jgi:hypothetical protein
MAAGDTGSQSGDADNQLGQAEVVQQGGHPRLDGG